MCILRFFTRFQVTQNWLNFCMGTLFWFAAAAIYHRVNPPNDPFESFIKHKVTNASLNNNSTAEPSFNSSSTSFDDILNLGVTDVIDWITGYEAGTETTSETGSETGREIEENPVKAFLRTFATVLTGAANILETAHRFKIRLLYKLLFLIRSYLIVTALLEADWFRKN